MLSRAIKYIDEHPLPEKAFYAFNACIAAFVLIGHGADFLATYDTSIPINWDTIITIAHLIASLYIIQSSINAHRKKEYDRSILRSHAYILGIFGIELLYWGISLAIDGFSGGSYSYAPGLLTIIVSYIFYQFRQIVLDKTANNNLLSQYLYVIAFLTGIVIEISIVAHLFKSGMKHVNISSIYYDEEKRKLVSGFLLIFLGGAIAYIAHLRFMKRTGWKSFFNLLPQLHYSKGEMRLWLIGVAIALIGFWVF